MAATVLRPRNLILKARASCSKKVGVRPEEAAIVGDSHVDVETGRNAGLWTVGVSYGFAPHTLKENPPDVLVDTPHELAEVFSAGVRS